MAQQAGQSDRDQWWINADLFLDLGRQFIISLPKDDPRPHVLILDSSLVFNLEFLELMRNQNVLVVCFPAHTTPILQSADKALFKSLKYNWNLEGHIFSRENVVRLQKSLLLGVLSKAWERAVTPNCLGWVLGAVVSILWIQLALTSLHSLQACLQTALEIDNTMTAERENSITGMVTPELDISLAVNLDLAATVEI